MKDIKGHSVSASAAEAVQVVLPNDTNPLGNVLGGRVMHWIDLIAAVVAVRHSKRPVVTASMEGLEFHSPIRLGQIAILKAALNYAGRTSMEVGVEVYAEDFRTGQRHHTSSAILTYVALDDAGRPTPVPPLHAETPDEKRRYAEAEQRYQGRKQRGPGR
ncbi:MAG TPA: acyl-CoA thioesterase [Nitrospiria bacterium]|nr:acyl-CoA thioesterase [Nitrospiria bacterium]HUK55586.1 acyl-CoA thioesterase [Nitrospiria bacterium]